MGVLGTGWIAEKFTGALHRHTRQRVYAVGSRSVASARRFADAVGAEAAYGSYEELVADAAVDVVYVATPHPLHLPNALLAIEAGKHVLVEKPIALSGDEVRRVAAAAREAGVLCMEALWSVFLPRFDVVRQLLADGTLGHLDAIIADMGQWFAPDHRNFRPDLAGGPLWDLGPYPIGLALWAMGGPARVQAVGSPAPGVSPDGRRLVDGEVNGQLGVTLHSDAGTIATLHLTVLGETPNAGSFIGSDAMLQLAEPFYCPGPLRLTTRSGEVLTHDEPADAHEGLHYQAAEVARLVADGATTSPLRTLEDSILMLDTFDEIRRQVGIPLP